MSNSRGSQTKRGFEWNVQGLQITHREARLAAHRPDSRRACAPPLFLAAASLKVLHDCIEFPTRPLLT